MPTAIDKIAALEGRFGKEWLRAQIYALRSPQGFIIMSQVAAIDILYRRHCED